MDINNEFPVGWVPNEVEVELENHYWIPEEEIQEWFKRCLNAFPRPTKYEDPPSYAQLWQDVYGWFHEWFLDLMPNLCEDCIHFINGECEELNVDGPLLSPVLPIHHPQTNIVIICPWYEGIPDVGSKQS